MAGQHFPTEKQVLKRASPDSKVILRRLTKMWVSPRFRNSASSASVVLQRFKDAYGLGEKSAYVQGFQETVHGGAVPTCTGGRFT